MTIHMVRLMISGLKVLGRLGFRNHHDPYDPIIKKMERLSMRGLMSVSDSQNASGPYSSQVWVAVGADACWLGFSPLILR